MTKQESKALRDALVDGPRRGFVEAPLGIWLRCLRDYPETDWPMADNLHTPLEILFVLATSDNYVIRAMIGGRNKAHPELLRFFVSDPDDILVADAVYSPHTPLESLYELLDYPWEKVRVKARERLTEAGML